MANESEPLDPEEAEEFLQDGEEDTPANEEVTNCHNCRKQIPKKAEKCPNCGVVTRWAKRNRSYTSKQVHKKSRSQEEEKENIIYAIVRWFVTVAAFIFGGGWIFVSFVFVVNIFNYLFFTTGGMDEKYARAFLILIGGLWLLLTVVFGSFVFLFKLFATSHG